MLYALVTWGPTPFAPPDAELVAAETADFFHTSSAGRLSLRSSVVGPLRLPRGVFDSCDATALRDATPASTFAGYDRIVFVAPFLGTCNFAGEANPTEVLLNGRLFMSLAAHELGHTLGLGHASRWDCLGRTCTVDEYGGEFSVMGHGSGGLNVYEKGALGWLSGVLRPDGRATYALGPVEGPTTLPQALVVTTAASEFWIESRGRPTPSSSARRSRSCSPAACSWPAAKRGFSGGATHSSVSARAVGAPSSRRGHRRASASGRWRPRRRSIHTTSGLPATGRSGTRRSSAEPSASSSSRLARIERSRSVPGSSPHGVIADAAGNAWITDQGLDAIVRVDRTTEAVSVHPIPIPDSNPNTAVFDQRGVLWFTGAGGSYGRVDPRDRPARRLAHRAAAARPAARARGRRRPRRRRARRAGRAAGDRRAGRDRRGRGRGGDRGARAGRDPARRRAPSSTRWCATPSTSSCRPPGAGSSTPAPRGCWPSSAPARSGSRRS